MPKCTHRESISQENKLHEDNIVSIHEYMLRKERSYKRKRNIEQDN
jgi:hypothetical protein